MPQTRFAREHDFDVTIDRWSAAYAVPGALVRAIIGKESEFNPNARALFGGDAARGGSYGLMQMSLATAQALGFTGNVTLLYDPAVNIMLGVRYLSDLVREARLEGYALDSAISAYNGGNSAYRRGDGRRLGPIAHATPDEARRVPFINQRYVDDVLRLLVYFDPTFVLTPPLPAAEPAAAPPTPEGDR